MDYVTLYGLLPKEPKKWSQLDVIKWLEFIGLPTYKDTFGKIERFKQFLQAMNSIDGSCLELISEVDVEQELCIKSNIHKKKIMNWVKHGLKEYYDFLRNKKDENCIMEIEQQPQTFLECEQFQQNENLENTDLAQHSKKQNENQMINDLVTNYYKQPNSVKNEIIPNSNQQYISYLQQFVEQSSNYELIIKPTEGNQTSFYSIKEQGGKIGRHSSNQILILEESISRFHAEILFKEGDFYLKDIGSTTGTFIKIDGKVQLNVGMMIELGSNQFCVESLQLSQSELTLGIFDGPNQPDRFLIKLHPQKAVYSIGRKATADISFPEDHHLSNIHAKVVLIDGLIYLEDMGSTNGSWLRLSKEGVSSEHFLLNHETTFKIGTTSTYTCFKQHGVLKEKNNTYACIICCENDRDALYLPCKHNTACLRCSKSLKDCPICRAKIEDTIRIYKN